VRSFNRGLLDPIVIPALAGALGLLVGAVILLFLGANPIDAYIAMVRGAFGSPEDYGAIVRALMETGQFRLPNAFADTLVKASPLLFVGVGTCIAYRCGVINIGGEGQIVIGAIATTGIALTFQQAPAWFLVPLGLLVGFLGGALWAGIAGVLKTNFRVNEVLSTIMLNSIAVFIMSFLLTGPLIDPTTRDNAIKIPQTQRLPLEADLWRWVPTRFHLGILLAILVAVLVYILLWRTTIGYRIRAVGLSPRAARYAGISVGRYQLLAFLLSGGLAGLGGAVEVLGVTHRLFTDGSAVGFTSSAGFNGIVAALFGSLHPIGTIPASILFGALLVGANSLQRTVQVPSAFVTTLDGLVVIFVVASQIWSQRKSARRVTEEPRAETTPAVPVPKQTGAAK
jgi:simple sugar transport system permease protein